MKKAHDALHVHNRSGESRYGEYFVGFGFRFRFRFLVIFGIRVKTLPKIDVSLRSDIISRCSFTDCDVKRHI